METPIWTNRYWKDLRGAEKPRSAGSHAITGQTKSMITKQGGDTFPLLQLLITDGTTKNYLQTSQIKRRL